MPRSLRLALSGPAVALVALAGGVSAGTISAGTPAAAQPAAISASATHSGAASSGAASRTVRLDAFTVSGAVKPNVSAGAGGGGGKVRPKTARQIARRMLRRFHWRARRQFRYLRQLWNRESGWNVHASNPYTAAYGIPQATPGSKMSTAGPDWVSSARTQIRWGLRYIRGRYGSPRAAWDHEESVGWY